MARLNLAPWIGLPHPGRRGCYRFAARFLAAEAGLRLPLVRDAHQAPGWARVERPQLFDIVIFNRGALPAHVGVCLGRGRFLHVEEGETSCIDYLSDRAYHPRIEGFYRCAT
ncbi:hypothetical protein EIM50_13705 [Pseudoxanthomonas sp. SGD-10]|nr:hypothetical protein EIM50_13705 [Pseudoxanthomonas sp. SGD-10]